MQIPIQSISIKFKIDGQNLCTFSLFFSLVSFSTLILGGFLLKLSKANTKMVLSKSFEETNHFFTTKLNSFKFLYSRNLTSNMYLKFILDHFFVCEFIIKFFVPK